MQIYTTYFAKVKQLPATIYPIAISRTIPPYFNIDRYAPLAPSVSILNGWRANHNEKVYIERYYDEILSRLTPQRVVQDLAQISHCNDIALVCFESSEKFCHRHLVAQWLRESGIDCREIDWR